MYRKLLTAVAPGFRRAPVGVWGVCDHDIDRGLLGGCVHPEYSHHG
jgi:hypothetical protein